MCLCLYLCLGCIHLDVFGLVEGVGVHVCIWCLWIVFGGSFGQLCFGNVYVVLLGKIVSVILDYVQLCLVHCMEIIYLCSSTSYNYDYWIVSIGICMM